MATDFSIFYREKFGDIRFLETLEWDIFVSAFNLSDRVRRVYDSVTAGEKYWLIHHEYGFEDSELPVGESIVRAPGNSGEAECIVAFLDQLPALNGARLCVDISGFMRPHLLLLLRLLQARGVRKFDALYAEPTRYVARESTEFSYGGAGEVRPIEGFAGTHDPSIDEERRSLLIIAVGYEHELIRMVAAAKNNSRKVQLVGFPPLQADFYQENRLSVDRAAEALSIDNERDPIFAPASDPFVAAGVLQEAIAREAGDVSGIYLAPLSTHPHALGVGLYWLYEAKETVPVTVLYPFMPRYARSSSSGVGRIWKYQIELPSPA